MNKKLLLISGLFLISFTVYCQQKSYHLDTLIFEIDEQIIVKIASYSNVWLNHYEGFNSTHEQYAGSAELIAKWLVLMSASGQKQTLSCHLTDVCLVPLPDPHRRHWGTSNASVTCKTIQHPPSLPSFSLRILARTLLPSVV